MLLSARRDDSLGGRRSSIKSKGRAKGEAIARAHVRTQRHSTHEAAELVGLQMKHFVVSSEVPPKRPLRTHFFFFLLRFMSTENMLNSPSSP